MLIENFIAALGFAHREKEIIAPFYADAVANFTGMAPFLSHRFVDEYYPLTNGAPDVPAKLHRVIDIAADSPALQIYAFLLHRAFYRLPSCGSLRELPLAEKPLGSLAGSLHILVAMSAMPLIADKFKSMGLPENYARAAFDWVRPPIEFFRAAHGVPGYTLFSICWPRHFIDGEMFRLGRFEYLLHKVRDYVPAVYRHNSTREVAALCPDNWRLNAHGHCLSGDKRIGETVKISRLESDGENVCGIPISPRGAALIDRKRTLNLREWSPVVSPWDCVPSIHIPGGGGMTLAAAEASFREAAEFFRTCLHKELKMLICNSWIFNTDWEKLLPDSHLSSFMRQLFLTPPIISGGDDGLYFVFGRGDNFGSDYPADTSLRRAFHQVRESGGVLKSGSMFFLMEDIDKFGTEYYRRNFDL